MRTLNTRHHLDMEQLEQRRLLASGPSIFLHDLAFTEGNIGAQNALVTVSLSAASNKSVSVGFRTEGGTANAGTDFQAVLGKLTFAPGERTKTIAVPVFGDRDVEPNEAFGVRIFSASNGKIGRGSGTVTVRDDEPRISITNATAVEGACRCYGPTQLSFTVFLSNAYDEIVAVDYATGDGTATVADGDYDAAFGTVTFAPGETRKTIVVSAWGDAKPEENEQFVVMLSGASSSALLLRSQGIGTIADDDGGATGGGTDPDPCLYVCCHPDGCGGGEIAP